MSALGQKQTFRSAIVVKNQKPEGAERTAVVLDDNGS